MKRPVSVLLANYNGGELLLKCLKSVFQQPEVGEVILVDNASSDQSVLKVKQEFPQVRVFKKKVNLGFGAAINQGAKLAKGEFILVLNTDVILKLHTLGKLVDFLWKQSSAGICAPIVKEGKNLNMGYFFSKSGFFSYQQEKDLKKPFEVFGVSGAIFLSRRKVFFEAGGFDPDFFLYSEDADLCWRVRARGWKVFVYPAIVEHFKGSSVLLLKKERVVFHSFKNRLLLIIKNLKSPEIFTVLPLHLVLIMGGSLLFLGQGKLHLFKGIIRALFWNLANLKEGLKKRKLVGQKFAYTPPPSLRRRVSLNYLFEKASEY